MKRLDKFRELSLNSQQCNMILGGETCYERRCSTENDSCDVGDTQVYEVDDDGNSNEYTIDHCE